MIDLKYLYNEINVIVSRYIAANIASKQVGIVSEVNPQTHMAKVKLQPSGVETNWCKISEPFASLGGTGSSFLPVEGDHVLLDYYAGSKQSPIITGRLYNDIIAPPNGIPGEPWIVHKSGSYFKLTNDGKLLLNGNIEIDLTAPTINIIATTAVNITASGEATITAPTTNIDGNAVVNGTLTVNGAIEATGDITDLDGANGSLDHIRTIYNQHIHSDPQGGNTGPADPQLA